MEMVYTQILTKAGIRKIMESAFINDVSVSERFGVMAIGTELGDFDESSPGLNAECNPATHAGYARVLTDNTITEETKTITIEGIFDQNNVATSGNTTIKEVGITDTRTIGSGTFLFLAEIPDMPKNQDVQLRYIVNIIFGE